MRKILQKIYRQPKEVRDSYALALAGLFTAVVCVFWVMARLQTPVDGGSIVKDNVSPFSTLVKKTKEQFAGVMAVVDEKSAVPVPPTATTTASVNAATLILSEENKDAVTTKASSTATSTQQLQPKEVLIGTTSASTTVQ